MTIHNDLARRSDPLEPEEHELLDAMESGELRSVTTPELLAQLKRSARATGQKDQRHRYACGELKDELRAGC